MRGALLALVLLGACSEAASPPPPPRPALAALLAEPKFQPDEFYTGADTPEDRAPLETAVNDTVREISALPEPLDKDDVRDRLTDMIEHTDLFATEDRDQVYRYAIRIWRAAGFKEESRLFPVADDQVLAYP